MTHYMTENAVSRFTESKMKVSQPLHFAASAIKIAPFPCAEKTDAAVLTREGGDCAFHLSASRGPKEQSTRKDI